MPETSLPPELTDELLIAACHWSLWRTVARGLFHALANASQMLALDPPTRSASEDARERISGAHLALAHFGQKGPAGPTVPLDVTHAVSEWQALQTGLSVATLAWDLDERLRLLATPPGDLAIALLALVTNAKEAAGETRANLTIAVRSTSAGSEWTVSDAGPGFTAEARARAFECGFTTRSAPHLGVGLACVQRLLRRSGGDAVLLEPARGAAIKLLVPAWSRPPA